MKLGNPITFLRAHVAELRHALRVVIAAGLAFAVVRLLGIPHGWWAVIASIMVVQTSVGGSLKAALDRLWGTIAGAFCGALVAIAIPHNNDIGLAIAMAAAILPLSFLAALNAKFRVAPITAVIVMLPIFGPESNPLVSAAERVLEVIIGNIAALTVTFAILPTRAQSQLREAAARVASLNADLMEQLIDSLSRDQGRQSVPPLQAKIRAALKQTETVAEEAARERRMRISDDPDPAPLVRTLYRVRHDLITLGRAAAKPLPPPLLAELGPPLATVRNDASTLLRGISASLLARIEAPAVAAYQASVLALAQAVEGLTDAPRRPPGEEAARVFTLRFTLERLGDDLSALADYTSELAKEKPPTPAG